MSDINFVENDKKEKKDKKKTNKEEKKTEWTNPEVLKSDKKAKNSKTKFQNSQTKNKENSLLKNKEKEKKGFLKWLDSLKQKTKKQNISTANDKKILAEHKNLTEKEKQNRLSVDNDKNKWKAARTLKTDLIKDELTVFFDWKKALMVFGANLLIVFFLLVVLYFGVILWKISAEKKTMLIDSEMSEFGIKISEVSRELEGVDEFREKAKIASILLDKHIYWTNFFKFIEENTLSNVYYPSSFSFDTSGEFSLNAQTDSFQTMSEQIKIFRQNPYVLNVDSSGGTMEGGADEKGASVKFSISLSLKPSIFLKNIKNDKVESR